MLYISSINDEVMNRPREPEQFFNYHYGWSFAFAASSFLLKEVSLSSLSLCMCVCAKEKDGNVMSVTCRDMHFFGMVICPGVWHGKCTSR